MQRSVQRDVEIHSQAFLGWLQWTATQTGTGNIYILRIMDRGCHNGLADTGDGQLAGSPLGSHGQSLQTLLLDPCTAPEHQHSKLHSRLWCGCDHSLYTLAQPPVSTKCKKLYMKAVVLRGPCSPSGGHAKLSKGPQVNDRKSGANSYFWVGDQNFTTWIKYFKLESNQRFPHLLHIPQHRRLLVSLLSLSNV